MTNVVAILGARSLSWNLTKPPAVVRGSLLVALAAGLLLPQVRSVTGRSTALGQDQTPAAVVNDKPTNGASAEVPPAADDAQRRFTLLVVGPDKQPVPSANVEVRGRPQLDPAWIETGVFERQATYGTLLKADQEGRLVLRLPQDATWRFSIKCAGYAPYWAEWEHESLPISLVAELDRGVKVGGIVVDESGQPIEGAVIQPSVHFKKRPGDTSALGVGTRATSDRLGRWTYVGIPENKELFSVEVTHSNFKPERAALNLKTYTLRDAAEPTARLVMKQGLSVTGTVVAVDGQPISGALVRTKFANDIRQATTDSEGRYRLTGCEPIVSKIVVSAPGKAIDMQEVQIEEHRQPVDFVMKPGGHVRIRVIDENQRPIPKARIFFQRWGQGRFEYFEFDHVDQFADADGIWEWNEAPLDEFQADICRPGGMQLGKQELRARDEEYVFSPPPALIIVGKVVDAESKQPIEKFQVVPGVRGDAQRMNWVPDETFEAVHGHFEYQRFHDYFAHLLKVQARGYLPAESRDIKSNEGRVEITFELERGTDIDMRVMTPDGLPAVGAKVALGIPGAQIDVNNGDIDDESTYAQREVVNAAGRFRFPAQSTAFQLVITHDSGYAHVNSETADRLDRVRLTAWASAEGVFRVAGQPVPDVTIYLNSGDMHSYGNEVPNIFTSSETVTGADGRYSFKRVFPGQGRVQRSILRVVGQGAKELTSATALAAEFVAGEGTTIDFGKAGTAAVGRLLPPRDFSDRVLWAFADVEVEPQIGPGDPPVPDALKDQPVQQNEWFEAWRQTEPGRAWLEATRTAAAARRLAPRYTATVDRDGNFKIDDMPAGDYLLSVRFWEGPPVGTIRNRKFTIDAAAAAHRTQVDLGTIQLE